MGDVLTFQANANAGKCELNEGTQGGMDGVVGEALAEARDRVSNTHSLLLDEGSWNRLAPIYEQYFLTKLVAGEARNEVLKRLVLTMNGLNGRVRLETPETITGDLAGTKQEAVGIVHNPALKTSDGYVGVDKTKQVDLQVAMNLKNARRAQKEAIASGDQNAVARANRDLLAANFGLNLGDVKEGMNLVREAHTGNFRILGNMKIQKSLFNKKSHEVRLGESAVRTIIHEATHKFAGAIDYCYFKLDGSGPAKDMGAESDGAKFFGDVAYGKTGEQLARMNADSFAWFCFRAGVPGF